MKKYGAILLLFLFSILLSGFAEKQPNYDKLFESNIVRYNSYIVSNATKEAEADIKKNGIKIFYGFSDGPYPIGIDGAEQSKFTEHMREYIGEGDIVFKQQDTKEYKDAFKNASLYGKLYNQTLARHFKWKQIDS